MSSFQIVRPRRQVRGKAVVSYGGCLRARRFSLAAHWPQLAESMQSSALCRL